jgi:tripartite-type tricarboxylate transporter receptor subunit TctC
MPAFFGIVFAALLALTGAGAANAQQDYPKRTIRIVTGSGPGAYDVYARLLAPKLQEALGQSIYIDNKVGANGMLSVQEVARAQPDGYTLLFSATGTLSINVSVMSNVAIDPARDLDAVAQVATVPMVWVTHPASGVKSIADLIALTRANPGKITYGLPAYGSLNHIVMEGLRQKNKLDFLIVPYKQTAQTQTDLTGGRLTVMVDSLGASMPFIADKRIVPLAVTTAERTRRLSDVATVRETGFDDRDYVGWYGFLAPKGTPREIVERLNKAINQALADPEIAERFRAIGAEPFVDGTPEQFGVFIASERDKFGTIVRTAGIKLDQ